MEAEHATSSTFRQAMIADTVQMASDIFDYLYAHPEEEFNERKNLLIAHLEDMELEDGDRAPRSFYFSLRCTCGPAVASDGQVFDIMVYAPDCPIHRRETFQEDQ